jgi:hypothetical protein
MQIQKVDSSAVTTIGYDADRRLLRVAYRNGGTYYYLNVPPETHQELMTAESIGTYVNTVIKPNYRVVRVEES